MYFHEGIKFTDESYFTQVVLKQLCLHITEFGSSILVGSSEFFWQFFSKFGWLINSIRTFETLSTKPQLFSYVL